MYRRFLKPTGDFLLSFFGLLFLSPVFLIIIIAIKLDSRGPVLFKQDRVGKDKKLFKVWKFRTMRIDTPKDTPTHLLENPDSYITKVGRFLRKTSLDELPQIFNILAGKMSIVGPRPALWNQDDLVAERDKYFANDVRPGLTGWAQVNGRDELEIPDKAKLDGEYTERLGPVIDIKVFFKTIAGVFKSDGVVEGGTGVLAKENKTDDVDDIDAVADETVLFDVNDGSSFEAEKEISEAVVSKDFIPKKVLITGAGSYIGNSVEKHLTEAGHIVEVIDMQDGSWREKDFSGFDTVFHVAGIAHMKEKRKNKNLYFSVNRDLAFEVAKTAKQAGVRQFVFMSSMSVYAGYGNKKISAVTPIKPKGYYGKSKAEAEEAISALQDSSFSVAVLRPPMIFGKDCKGNFPRLAKLAVIMPLFPKIKNERSMLHVDNLCEFIKLLAESGDSGVFFPQNREYFCTTELAVQLAEINGKKLKTTRIFNWAVWLLYPFLGQLKKMFGTLIYNKSLSDYKDNHYQIIDNYSALVNTSAKHEEKERMYKAAIMAGGKGTRLLELTKDELPKPMIPVKGKPILQHQIECLKNNGVKEVTLIIGHLGEKIREYFKSGEDFGLKIDYIEENEPLGTAGALYFIKERLQKDDLLLVFGDTIFDIDINRMYDFHRSSGSSASIFVHPNSHPYDSDLILVGENDKVKAFDSKNNKREGFYRNCVNAGLYFLSSEVLKDFDAAVKKDLDKDIIFPLISQGRVSAYKSTEYIKDAGTVDRVRDVEKDIEKGVVRARNLSLRQKCVFLDRDGTINMSKGFISNAKDMELTEGAAEAIKLINKSGYLALVVTNQPVIARGECTLDELEEIHAAMETLLGREGAYIDDLRFCPHHPDKGFEGERPEYKFDCSCRKPKPGMLDYFIGKYNIDKEKSFMVGDDERDMQAGFNAGVKSIRVSKGYTVLDAVKDILAGTVKEGENE